MQRIHHLHVHKYTGTDRHIEDRYVYVHIDAYAHTHALRKLKLVS